MGEKGGVQTRKGGGVGASADDSAQVRLPHACLLQACLRAPHRQRHRSLDGLTPRCRARVWCRMRCRRRAQGSAHAADPSQQRSAASTTRNRIRHTQDTHARR
eukprot:3934578-Rhodomonas_salina.2